MKKYYRKLLVFLIIIVMLASYCTIPGMMTNNIVNAETSISKLSDASSIAQATIQSMNVSNNTTDDNILLAVSSSLGSEYVVEAVRPFVFDAAVDGAIIKVNGNEISRTKTANGAIEGTLKISKDNEHIYVPFNIEIPSKMDETSYNYTVDDIVETNKITVQNKVVTSVNTSNKKLLVVDGNEVGATSISRNAFYNGSSSTLSSSIEVVIFKNVSYTSYLVKASNVKVIILEDGVTIGDSYRWIDGFGWSLQGNFGDCLLLEYLSLSKDINIIGQADIANCKSLKGVVIPESIKTVCAYAFTSSSNLLTVSFPKRVLNDIFTCTQPVREIFNGCDSLVSIRFPEGVTNVPQNAFSYCKNLRSVILPTTLTSINQTSFAYCTSLKTIVLPSNTTTISSDAFKGDIALETIIVSGNSLGDAAISSLGSVYDSLKGSKLQKILAWGNTKTFSKLGEKSQDLATYISTVDNASLTSYYANNKIKITVEMEQGFEIPKQGINFDYKKSDGTILSPKANRIENTNVFEFEINDPIAYGLAISNARTFSLEEVNKIYEIVNSTIKNYDFSINTTKDEVLNAIMDRVDDKDVKYVWIDELDKTTPVDNAEIYLDGKLIESTPKKDGSIIGTLGIVVGDYTRIATIEKILYAKTERYDYSLKDLAPDDAFEINNNSDLIKYTDNYKLVIVPDKVLNIQSSCTALQNLTKAETIIFTDKITMMLWSTCYQSTSIEVAILNNDNSRSVVNGRLVGANFQGCTSLKYVKIAEGITNIGQDVFANTPALKSVILPSDLKILGQRAFYNSGITDFSLPASLTSIDSSAFSDGVVLHRDSDKQKFFHAMKAFESFMLSIPNTLDQKEKVEEELSNLITNENFSYNVTFFERTENHLTVHAGVSVIVDGYSFEYEIKSDKNIANYKLYEIIEIAQNALDLVTFDNNTVSSDIIETVEKAIDDDRVEVNYVQDFDKVRSINGANVYLSNILIGKVEAIDGRITAVVGLKYKGETATIIIDKTITAPVANYKYNSKAPDSCFKVDENGVLRGYTGKGYDLVVVPKTVKSFDYEVLANGDNGGIFASKDVETVIIPETVSLLMWNTFMSSSDLEVVIMPDKIGNLPGNTFMNCTALKYVRLPKNLTKISESSFLECTSLQSISLPERIIEIEKRAFYNTGLYELTVPSSVNGIYFEAFATNKSNTQLDKITILSKDVEYFDSVGSRSENSAKSKNMPLSGYRNSIIVKCYDNSTTKELLSKTVFQNDKPELIYKEYIDQTYLDAVYEAKSIVDNMPSDTESAKLLKEFIERKIINKLVKINVEDFYYSTSLIKAKVQIIIKYNGDDYFVELSGNKTPKIAGFDSLIIEAQKVIASMKLTDETTQEDFEKSLISEIDSGTAKISWPVEFAKRKSVRGAIIKSKDITKEIPGTDGKIAGYINISFKGKTATLKVERVIEPEIEVLNYKSVSNTEDFNILDKKLYGYSGSAELVVIPNDVEEIEANAFRTLSGIKAIIIPDGVAYLPSEGFSLMSDLEAVWIPDSCVRLGTSSTNPDNEGGACFKYDEKLKYVRLSPYTTIIPYYTFSNCFSLTEFYIPEGIETLGQRSFWRVENMKDLVIPSSVTTISSYVFAGNNATGQVEFELISVLSDDMKYESDVKLAGPFACYSNKEVIINYPYGAEANYLDDSALGIYNYKITTVGLKQSLSQAAIDLQRLFNDYPATNETTKEQVESKIEKLITNNNLKYQWVSNFKLNEVTQTDIGNVSGKIMLYDSNNKNFAFTISLDKDIPLCVWVDNRTITVYPPDEIDSTNTSNNDKINIKQKNKINFIPLVIMICCIVILLIIGAVVTVIIIKRKKQRK